MSSSTVPSFHRSGGGTSKWAAGTILLCGFLFGLFVVPIPWQDTPTQLTNIPSGDEMPAFGHKEPPQIRAADKPPKYTHVHCVCGPQGVSAAEHGCVPVVENALITVEPRVRVTFTAFFRPNVSLADQEEREIEILKKQFADCRARSYFPTASTTFVFATNSRKEKADNYYQACERVQAPVYHEVLFLIVRWGGWTPFHNLFDHGLFQVWMGWLTVKKFVEDLAKVAKSRSDLLLTTPAIHVVQCMMGFQPPFPPIHELWLRVLKPRVFQWMEETSHCSAFAVVGDLPASTSGNHRHLDHLFVSPGLQYYLRYMASLTTMALIDAYGDRPFSELTPVMYDNREVLNGFDHDQRSRGLQPQLKKEFESVLDRLVGKGVSRTMSAEISLKDQFHWIRSSRVIVGGEGALFAFMFLSRPNTTWICVYNHTRPPKSFKFTNFHAPAAHALSWIRVIFYMIDHGMRVPVDEALTRFFPTPASFTSGVYYVGSDRFGHREETLRS